MWLHSNAENLLKSIVPEKSHKFPMENSIYRTASHRFIVTKAKCDKVESDRLDYNRERGKKKKESTHRKPFTLLNGTTITTKMVTKYETENNLSRKCLNRFLRNIFNTWKYYETHWLDGANESFDFFLMQCKFMTFHSSIFSVQSSNGRSSDSYYRRKWIKTSHFVGFLFSKSYSLFSSLSWINMFFFHYSILTWDKCQINSKQQHHVV